MEPELHTTIPAVHPAAVIGNGETCALVSVDGSVTWLAFPHAGGRAWLDTEAPFFVRPRGDAVASFDYVGETPVLQTTWRCGDARACVTDFLPVRPGEGGQARRLRRRLVRLVEVLEGEMEFSFRLAPRPGGKPVELIEDPAGLLLVTAGQALVLQTSGEVRLQRDGVVTDTFCLARGQRRAFVLTWHPEADPDVEEMGATEPDWELDGTYDHWLAWGQRCPFQGVQRPHILRVLALLAATASPVPPVIPAPGFVASPTQLLAAAALAAWGYEDALSDALRRWQPHGTHMSDFLDGATLLDALAEGYSTGMVEPGVWLPYEPLLVRWSAQLTDYVTGKAAAHFSTRQIVTLWLGLRGVLRLEDEGLWRSGVAAVQAAVECLEGWLLVAPDAPAGWRALGAEQGTPDGLFLDDPERPALGADEMLWAIRCTLHGGAYTQARRALDRFWLQYSPVWNPALALAEGADRALWAQAAWLSAKVYLQEPPKPGRVNLPDEWD